MESASPIFVESPVHPDVIDRYRVLGTLGRGGMGVVYRARDERLDREVALKMLPDEDRASDDSRQRLLVEARAAARIDHPNVCSVYEVGETEDGHAFVAMGCYDGETLRDRLRSGPLAPEEVSELGRQIASGLAAAHARGIVHRDLKPSNIFLCESDRLTAKILDFGIAKVEGTDLTKSGITSGTLFYAAPEQARGKAEARSDLWSLGVVLYEALTGCRPFEGSYEAATLYSILHEAPTPLPTGTSEPLASVVMRLLEKAPEARPGSAAEVEQALTGAPLAPEATRRSIRTRWLGGAVGATLALLLLLGWSFWPDAVPEAQARHLAVLPFASPGADSLDAALAGGLAPLITSELADVTPTSGSLLLIPSSEVRETGVTRTAEVASVLGATAVLRGTLRRQGDSLAVELEVVDAASSRLLASRTVAASGDTPSVLVVAAVGVVSDALRLGADAMQIAARQATAPEAYGPYIRGLSYLEQPTRPSAVKSALMFFEEAAALDPDSPFVRAGLAQALYRRFVLSYDVADLERAETEAQRVLELARDRVPEASALAHITLASGAIERGQYSYARDEARKAVVLAPGLDAARRTLGRALEKSGRIADAEIELRKAVSLRRSGSWMAQNTLGGFFFRQGRFDEAQEAFREAIRLLPDNATSHYNLGAAIYNASGDASAAIPHFETSIDFRETPEALGNFATALYYDERYAEAADMYRRALALDPTDAYVWGFLYASLDHLGLEADAREALEEAVQAAANRLRVNPNNASLLASAATYNATLGRMSEAERLIEQAVEHGRDNMDVLADAASVYHQLGRAPEARQWLNAAIESGFEPAWVEADSVLRLIKDSGKPSL